MKTLKQKILACAIERWHEEFIGMSGLDIADYLKITHKKVLEIFDELEREKKGSVRREVTLYRFFISINGYKHEDTKPIKTSIFFPAKEVLSNSFYSSNLHRLNIPEYKARLYKGGSQIELIYFLSEVLRKYLDHPEIFDVENTITGGCINPKQDYFSQLSEEEQDKIDFIPLDFGKRRLKDGNEVVTAILYDLSELPEREQAYWHSYEIEKPQFSVNDPDFTNYFRRNFGGEFLNSKDPLRDSLLEVNRINNILAEKGGLFSEKSNLYLSYPVVNTYKNFSDRCSELYKIIGPDSLREKTLKCLLKSYFNYQQKDFFHPETNRPLGKLDLFKHLCIELGCEGLSDIIREIKDHRISADHSITSPQQTNKNYYNEFRRILNELYDNLRTFAIQIEGLKKGKKFK